MQYSAIQCNDIRTRVAVDTTNGISAHRHYRQIKADKSADISADISALCLHLGGEMEDKRRRDKGTDSNREKKERERERRKKEREREKKERERERAKV